MKGIFILLLTVFSLTVFSQKNEVNFNSLKLTDCLEWNIIEKSGKYCLLKKYISDYPNILLSTKEQKIKNIDKYVSRQEKKYYRLTKGKVQNYSKEKINNIGVYILEWNDHYGPFSRDYTIRSYEYHIPYGNKIYTITYAAESDNFNQFFDEAKSIMNSFKIN